MRTRLKTRLKNENGYVLALVMLVLLAVGIMSATLLTQIQFNQQHVTRDRAYSQSLAVAEAGLNQYLWMIASGASTEANNFAIPGSADPHHQVFTLTDPDTGTLQGQYAMQIYPAGADDARVKVRITGLAASTTDVPRTVEAHLGRPSFSEYVLLVDESVYIGGPLDRVWHGKTHSNTGIRIDTENIIDSISCAQAEYQYSGTKPGIWSDAVPASSPSRAYWHFPVPQIDFDSVTSDFARLSSLATGDANLPYASSAGGWHIELLPNKQYRVRRVASDTESASGGSITYASGSSWTTYNYPNNGVIYVNDDVWVNGTGITGRITIASSGQLNSPGQQQTTDIHIIDDLTYAVKDGTVAVGLISQNNVVIPTYAPYSKMPPSLDDDMEIDAAIIAQKGKEYVNYFDNGPKRDTLTFFGSISSKQTPVRASFSGSTLLGGFKYGANIYDSFLLHNPPPYFPMVGTYQILDWNELPNTEAVSFE